jgi:hypothetical protein
MVDQAPPETIYGPIAFCCELAKSLTFNRMRYVVKHKETGRFLSSTGEWTSLLREAERFPNGLSVNLHLESAVMPPSNDLQIVQLPIE